MNEDNDNYETEQQREYAEIIEEATVNMTSELPRLVAEFKKMLSQFLSRMIYLRH